MILRALKFVTREAYERGLLLWYASPFHRHDWWYMTIAGTGINYRTGVISSEIEDFEVCVRCRKRRPRQR